jgi:YidC/Oxa1 family membrane protein insertase
MDKQNTTIGVLLLVAALASIYFGQKLAPAPAPVAPQTVTAPAQPAGAPAGPAATPAQPALTSATSANSIFASVAQDAANATVTTLANEYITVNFSDFGGAIRDVALNKFPAVLGNPAPVVFNDLHADPMLAFVEFPGLDRHTGYQLVSKTAGEVVYRAVLNHTIEVTRRYTLVAHADKANDPYQLHHETTFRNLTAQPVPLPRVELSIGTAAPVDEHDVGLQLTAGYSNGDKQTFIPRSSLEGGSGFLGMGASEPKSSVASPGPVTWSAVTNRFFATILTPDQPGSGFVTRRVKLHAEKPDADHNAYGLTGAAQFDVKPLAANGESRLAAAFYVGPKEYHRLAQSDIFKADQDKVMQFGFFKWFSQLLLTLMTWMHGFVPNWGVAIILTTLTLKIVFLPLTLKASKSMKRMAKLQPEMAALRVKYKDNPQKQQTALMELYKQHKINPLGGCIPMMLPLPFFFGMFTMLQSAAELRFQPFLWAHDLSASDTIGHIFGFPVNIMPLLMGATMFVSTQLTPMPSADNAQAKMMKFMPIIFTMFCYTFSCALSLYSFINGLFTIGQQLVINRMKDDDPALSPAVVPGGKPVKNVTPKKKG